MIERKILIALITSTEYCERIKDIWNVHMIESATAKRIASWAWTYFEKHKACPGKQIELIFFNHAKKLPKDLAEEIELEILPSLSEEYENQSFNVDYMVEETEKHFKSRKLSVLSDSIQTLLANDQLDEAEELTQKYKAGETVAQKLDSHILSVVDIRKKESPKPITFLSPWLKAGQTTIIYGNFGCGKSLLTISVSYILGLKRYDEKECEIAGWQVKHPTGCLYIDGELGEQEMEERVKQFEWLGKQADNRRMKILSIPEYQLNTESIFNLADRDNQSKVIQWLKNNPSYKLVVLDSVSTVFGLIEENDNSEWNNKINPFLRDLRALNVSCLLLHHAGKDGKRGLRGASSMGAMAHNIYKLSDHPDKNRDDGEAWFVLTKDKQRSSGFSFKSFGLHFSQNSDETETHWKVTKY